MNKNLIYYVIICVFNLITLYVSGKMIVYSIVESSILGTLIFSLLFALTTNEVINRQRNFVKYYPNFTDKWLF